MYFSQTGHMEGTSCWQRKLMQFWEENENSRKHFNLIYSKLAAKGDEWAQVFSELVCDNV